MQGLYTVGFGEDDQVDVGQLAASLQTGEEELADTLGVKADDDGLVLIRVSEVDRVATPKNRKLKLLGIDPEQVAAAARELALGHLVAADERLHDRIGAPL